MHSFLQRSGFHTGPLVPVTFRSPVVFILLLENAIELLFNSDGARCEVSFPEGVANAGSEMPEVCQSCMVRECQPCTPWCMT